MASAIAASSNMQRVRSARPTNALQTFLPIIPALFILSVLIPTDISFEVGGLRLTPYRIVLILAFIPAAWNVFAGKHKPVLSDFFMIGYVAWAVLTIAKHEGVSAMAESGGIFVLEAIGPYFIARAFVRTPAQFRGVIRALVLSVLLMLPFVAFEALTGKHVIRDITSSIMGGGFYSPIDTRFGLHRAYGPFDHPIHLGVYCASIVGIAWYSAAKKRTETTMIRGSRTMGVVGAAVSSVSSGAMAAISTQGLLLAWERATRGIKNRWLILTACLVAGYIFIDLLSNRSGAQVILARLTFSASTAYGRMIIFEWGFYHNVLVNPIFGIGLTAEWVRPSWMTSGSMDNFWLVVAVRHGLPAFFLLAAATLVIMVRAGKASKRLGPVAGSPAMGWVISFIAIIVAGSTVHFWNGLFAYFSFMLGIGVCLASPLWHAEVPKRKRLHPAARRQQGAVQP